MSTTAFSKGSPLAIISICLGAAVLPIITTVDIMIFGMMVYRNFQTDSPVNVINIDSIMTAFMKNFGLPI